MTEESSTLRQPLPLSWVSKIFQRMQGRYGSVWIDRWRSGEKDCQGLDAGVQNALQTWADELSGFVDKPECIKFALEAWSGAFPPSLPEFRELCREYGRRKQQDALKLSHKLTPEEREQQKAMADKIAGAVKKASSFDDLEWARKPRSTVTAYAIFTEAKAGNRALAEVFDGHVEQGVMDQNGKLLQKFDGTAFVRA